MSALEERRDRARKAFEECPIGEHDCTSCSRDRCIETATRVHVDDAIIQAARPGTASGSVVWKRTRAKLVRAFEAAGFEVTT
jgi:hypothetical protein